MNFVHQLPDQIDAASVVSIQVFTASWIGEKLWIETWSGIGHDNYNSAALVTLQTAPDLF